jgi:hypothetical protein
VQALVTDESDGNDDEDQMDDMIADIGIEYDLGVGWTPRCSPPGGYSARDRVVDP